MKACIAIPYEEGRIFPKFGAQKQMKVYSIDEGAVSSSQVVDMSDVPREEMGIWLVRQGVNAILCSEIDPIAYGCLMAAGIPAVACFTGDADLAIEKLLSGQLADAVPGAGGCSGCSGCSSCRDGSCCQGGCQ